jgi:hypothetical protein
VAAALLALLGGCASEKGSSDASARRPAEAFRKPDEVSDVARINALQISAGARTDATLRAYHFRDGKLNSLGREKLESIAGSEADRDGQALVVYLDVPAAAEHESLANVRQEAVARYLREHGLAEDAFRIERGHNPSNTFPAVSPRRDQPAPPAGSQPEGPGMGPNKDFGGGLTQPAAGTTAAKL